MKNSTFQCFYNGKKILVTGHTGFKGTWLCQWLRHLGSDITGFALDPPSTPNLFDITSTGNGIQDIRGDIRDLGNLCGVVEDCRPEIIFHLAAQSLVRPSYLEPIETFQTNAMGTANLLEACRRSDSVKACIIVTSDKCYENRDWVYAYRESDPMGGYDPYSSSKGCAELITAAYRKSFFNPHSARTGHAAISTARAGNVIGGGDWGKDRLLPDCVRALSSGKAVEIRNPESIRPWQHVLEPLSGYLWLAVSMCHDPIVFSQSWNFGPLGTEHLTVGELVEHVVDVWGQGEWRSSTPGPASDDAFHEAKSIKLDCTKAHSILNWKPLLTIDRAIRMTMDWYRLYYTNGADPVSLTREQILLYEDEARRSDIPWAHH